MLNTSELLKNIANVRIGVIGDFCLDVYWHADMRKSELSRETPHFPLPIVSERLSPGGAGNVVANICALKPARVKCLGVFGNDWRGMALKGELEKAGADISGVVLTSDWITNTYIKPLRQGLTDVVYEDPRLDFTNYAVLPQKCEKALISNLEAEASSLDVLCVCDQRRFSCITEKVRNKIMELATDGLTVIVDSRDRIGLYANVIVKPNAIEACHIAQIINTQDIKTLCRVAKSLETRTRRPVGITIGDKGCIVCSKGKAKHIEAIKVDGEIDICGAGDTFMSALACAIGTGATIEEAAFLGNVASSITIRKLKQTGTASPEEILSTIKQKNRRKA